jgi:hypothetical protein
MIFIYPKNEVAHFFHENEAIWTITAPIFDGFRRAIPQIGQDTIPKTDPNAKSPSPSRCRIRFCLVGSQEGAEPHPVANPGEIAPGCSLFVPEMPFEWP